MVSFFDNRLSVGELESQPGQGCTIDYRPPFLCVLLPVLPAAKDLISVSYSSKVAPMVCVCFVYSRGTKYFQVHTFHPVIDRRGPVTKSETCG